MNHQIDVLGPAAGEDHPYSSWLPPRGRQRSSERAFYTTRHRQGNAGTRKLEAGSWKLEAGSWKLEAGSWKLEAGRQAESATKGIKGFLPA
ncbi:hypothetical protein [Halomonas sp. M4R1S46]|uniref:hypothetical protein n=1 Tax=Halomonas sp. M4R1S46 TaxID=2982692 RepID=UPI0021E37EA9|nr:hypothetical protein [Halomonas sp. M4R1S46]UYG08859.1 hypothetical protein OCT48_05875 [Halomonas sp. M4R1S46]